MYSGGHTHTHTHTHTQKANKTPPSISSFPTAVNHRYQQKVCYFCSPPVWAPALCANLYSVDWLDGQSTWPIYAYERILWKLSSRLMTGMKLSHARAINCTTMSNVNSFSLVFSIFCEAWESSIPLPPASPQQKWSNWIYCLLLLLKVASSFECFCHQDNQSWTDINTSYKYSWLIIFCTAVMVIIGL